MDKQALRMQVLQETETNMRKRAKLAVMYNEKTEGKITEGAKNLRLLLFKACRDDIFFFIEYFSWTIRDHNFYGQEFGGDIPLILYDFQKSFVKGLSESIQEASKPSADRTFASDVFIEKSRQMGISWLVCLVFVYFYIFYDYRFLLISAKQDLVDGDEKSLFTKIRYIISKLPMWMLPKGLTKEQGTKHNRFMHITRGDGQGCIEGESANKDAGRGGTYNAILLDEMASMDHASDINSACASATACRIFNSTPKGKGNEFYRIRRRIDECFKRKSPLPCKYYQLHWTEHPFYDQKWYDDYKSKNTKEKVAAEVDISYDISLEGRVFPEYAGEVFDNVVYDDKLPLYCFIDNSHGGADPHAVIMLQPKGHLWNVVEAFEVNCTPAELASVFGRQPTFRLDDKGLLEFYGRYELMKKPIFVADPFDTNYAMGNSTIQKDYDKYCIHLETPRSNGMKYTDHRNAIMEIRNNMTRFRISEENAFPLSMAMTNWTYQDREEGSNATNERKPKHDGFDLCTALCYGITYILSTNIEAEHNFDKVDFIGMDDPRQNWYTPNTTNYGI